MPDNTLPDWLEPIVCLPDFDGDPQKYIDHVFSLFKRDFITSKPKFKGKIVMCDIGDEGGKPRGFNHITTEEDRNTGVRELCLRRCERITWIKSIIENHTDPKVLYWEQEHFGKGISIRIFLFLESQDFLVILTEKKKGYFVITAIYVDQPHMKKKHLKAHSEFQKKQAGSGKSA
jgi:hypothetical protein